MADQEVLLKVDGMTCNNCAAGISKSLKSAGFKDADANFMDGEVSFTLLEGKSPQEAIERIESLGYSVKSSDVELGKGLSAIEKKFVFALVFTLPLFMHMFVPHHWILNDPLVQIGLCLPVYVLGFLHFGKSAWGSIKAKYANMDVLIFMGSSAAFFYSIAGTIMFWGMPEIHDYMFFETTATIITLVLLGNVLEHRSIQQTAVNIGELTKMQAAVARIVMRVNGKEKLFETEAKNVKAGDELQVNEGDHLPTDGKVLAGTALVDESAITGESDPVEKIEGSLVFSGTTLLSGNIRMEASVAAKESTLQKIIDLVKKARKDQPQIQKLGDKVSGIFVPVVLGISALTFVIAYFAFQIGLTQSLMNAVAVLVISCPCAMGLATPTAIVAGVGRAAKNGILIKGGSTLERFAQGTTIIFDKTGTLTTGKFNATWIQNNIGDRAAALIKGLESRSSHPIAKALSSHWPETEPEALADIREVKGEGIFGETPTGEKIFFGTARSLSGGEAADLELTIDGTHAATLAIQDDIKPGAKSMVEAFKSEGFNPIILSGDKKEKVLSVARTLGIEHAHYAMSPQAKLDFIEEAASKETVVMVGDGINDGPALSRAQVGISPGGASALALDSARVVIMHPDEMASLAYSFKISKHTYRTIKQNLFWAFFYNVMAIPLAAFGFLNPMIAALAMAFSDVVVIGNSLRLKVKKLK
jgi:Cu+-exporting ATPase